MQLHIAAVLRGERQLVRGPDRRSAAASSTLRPSRARPRRRRHRARLLFPHLPTSPRASWQTGAGARPRRQPYRAGQPTPFDEGLAIAVAAPSATRPLALLYLDIDRFKAINDSLGAVGDTPVIREFAQRLQLPTGPGARLGRQAACWVRGSCGAGHRRSSVVRNPLRAGRVHPTRAPASVPLAPRARPGHHRPTRCTRPRARTWTVVDPECRPQRSAPVTRPRIRDRVAQLSLVSLGCVVLWLVRQSSWPARRFLLLGRAVGPARHPHRTAGARWL